MGVNLMVYREIKFPQRLHLSVFLCSKPGILMYLIVSSVLNISQLVIISVNAPRECYSRTD